MANPNFTATMSSNEIWCGTDNTRCITDDLDAIEADILELETSKADTDHTHSGYAATTHEHSDYASTSHTHSYNDLSDTPTIPTIPASLPAIEDSTHPGCYYRTVNGATEWINPPMILGTEYRTIERWNGKVVYVKLVDCGMLPNASTKTVTHGASASQILRCLGQCLGNHTPIPRDWRGGEISIFADRIDVLITTNVNYSDQPAYAQIWYTKD